MLVDHLVGVQRELLLSRRLPLVCSCPLALVASCCAVLSVLRALVEQVVGEVGRLTAAIHRFDAHAVPLNRGLVVIITRVEVSIVVVDVLVNSRASTAIAHIYSKQWLGHFTGVFVL